MRGGARVRVVHVEGLPRSIVVARCPRCGYVFASKARERTFCPKCAKTFRLSTNAIVVLEPERGDGGL